MTIRACLPLRLQALQRNASVIRAVACIGIGVLLCAGASLAQTYTVLHTFTGPPDGANPIALMLDNAGNLYGATGGGGDTTGTTFCSPGGCGTIFKIGLTGKEHILYRFSPNGVFNGYLPQGPSLVQDAQHNIYGTTLYGGALGCNVYGGEGCGTVFKLDPTGHETALYRFTQANGNGTLPAGLVQDAAGNLYGTTYGGGIGYGTVFKVDSQEKETILHVFQGPPNDGAAPIDGVVLDADGNLYGTTFSGGANSSSGTIFKVSNAGVETILHDFGAPGSIGGEIEGTLIRDSAGNLYGTAVQGGDPSCSCGLVYKLDPAGNYSVLYSFTFGSDGAYPQTGLAIDAAGNLYGTTRNGGGTHACGTVFKLTPSGTLTPLHAFTDGCGRDDIVPFTAPVVDSKGNVYGTTAGGGLVNSACYYGCGVVFKITP